MSADIFKAFHYKLVNSSGVTALVSQRVFSVSLPQDSIFPAIVYQPVSGAPIAVHDDATLLPTVRMQVAVWGADLDEILPVDAAVKTAIDGYRGSWGTSPYVTNVQMCVADTVPIFDRDPETLLWKVIRSYKIMWQE